MSKLKILVPLALLWLFQDLEVSIIEEITKFEDPNLNAMYIKRNYTFHLNFPNFNIILQKLVKFLFIDVLN